MTLPCARGRAALARVALEQARQAKAQEQDGQHYLRWTVGGARVA